MPIGGFIARGEELRYSKKGTRIHVQYGILDPYRYPSHVWQIWVQYKRNGNDWYWEQYVDFFRYKKKADIKAFIRGNVLPKLKHDRWWQGRHRCKG